MFIIVPLIIVFLCSSYLYLNDVSMITTIMVYCFEIVLIVGTLKLYKKFEEDMELQEKNKIKEEIFLLKQKIHDDIDEVLKTSLLHKITNLEKELRK